MSEGSSYRQILRSSSIMGGASVVNILISLLRTKAAALLLGPAGVGLVGLFQNLIATGATLASLGFGRGGVRQIADAVGRNDATALAAARRALFWGTLILGVVGSSVFWLLRGALARHVLGDPSRVADVGWLALGVLFTVAGISQGVLLTGMRRIGDVARVDISQAVLATVVGVGALWLWGTQGLLVFVLITPVAGFVMGHVYVARLPRVQAPRTPLPQLLEQWRELVRFGTALTVAAMAMTVGQLVVRAMVQHELDAAALGQFQAAWAISMTYVGFVLSTMGTDYYPRITAVIHDHSVVNRMVNEQTEVALLLAGPIFLVTLSLAPWLIELLYSSKFAEATAILRWQVIGDLLKVASWPLVYLMLASGDARNYMLVEVLSVGVFAGLVWIGLGALGVQATGLGIIGMYSFYLPALYYLARRKTGFGWTNHVKGEFIALVLISVGLDALAYWSPWIAMGVGLPVAAAFLFYGLTRLAHMTNLGGRVGRVAENSRRVLVKAGVWYD